MLIRYFLALTILILITACGGPEPRKPVEVKSGSFIRESVERNKALLAQEEQVIKAIIEADTTNQYNSTDFGAWFSYNNQNQEESYQPKEGDIVKMNYDILSLQNDTIYSMDEIGEISYNVDREEIFKGLRLGVKILKEGEHVTFLFPSHLAFGYHGDNDKIGPNVPIKSNVTILKIEQTQDSILK